MKTIILCKIEVSGYHSLYLVTENKEYYLFRQAYRKGVAEYYRSGVYLDDAIDFSKARGNTSIKNTMSKLISHIRYAEKEFGIAVLDRTRRRSEFRQKNNCA